MENKHDYDVIIGVDLGLTGGLCFLDVVTGEILSLKKMPTKIVTKDEKEKTVLDIGQLLFLLEIPKAHNDNALVVFEDIHAFGNSGFGVGVIMEQKGVLRGLIESLQYTPVMVSPRTWQNHFGIKCPKGIHKKKRNKWLKDKSREVASEKFPSLASHFQPIGSHGLSDATLLAQWCFETN